MKQAARLAALVGLMCLVVSPALAQQARLALVEDGLFASPSVTVELAEGTAYRAFVLTNPPRLVLDFETTTASASDQVLLGPFVRVETGRIARGWSRMILTLDAFFQIDTVSRPVPDRLNVALRRTSLDAMQQAEALAPGPEVLRDLQPPSPPATRGKPRIVLDPGHGGIDPGAVREGISEKDIVLDFALEFAEKLRKTGRYDVLLTRETDQFVLLDDRVAVARNAQATLFLSLHVNTVTEGHASGATLYVASKIASDPRSAAVARLENRSDNSAGAGRVDLQDDIALTVMDLARAPTAARARMAAESMVTALGASTGTIRSRPLRSADFRVLRAPDMPSLLLELGFLSDPQERAKMTSPEWRDQVGDALILALDGWIAADAAFLALMRQ